MEQVLQLVGVYFAALATGGPTTIRSRAGPFRALPPTARRFAPVGFDFTLSALSSHFQHWPATFLLVLSVDDPLRTGFGSKSAQIYSGVLYAGGDWTFRFERDRIFGCLALVSGHCRLNGRYRL